MSISRGKALVQMILNQDVSKNRDLTNPDNLSINQCSNGENKENPSIVFFESEECIPKINWNLAQLTPAQNIVIEECSVAASAWSETIINSNTSPQDFSNREPNDIFNGSTENLSTGSDEGSNFEPGSDNLGCSESESSDNNDTGDDLAEDQHGTINTDDRGGNENASSNTEKSEDQGTRDIVPLKKRKMSREQRFQNKRLRMLGQCYNGLQKDPSEGNYKLTNIAARKMGPTCSSRVCKNSKVFFCPSFHENDRKLLFDSFWKTLTWDMKRTYLSSLVDYVPSKRMKENSRRKGTLIYYLKKGTQKLRVCKKMFLSTLNVNEWIVREYSKKLHGITEAEENVLHPRRNRHSNDQRRITMQTFLEELPKMPSHYCRSSTSKLYLEPTFQSKAELYREYQRYCATKNENSCSQQLFNEEIKKQKIGIFRPRKDQCDVCISHKLGNIDEDTYQKHQASKIAARNSKENDKGRCQTEPKKILVITADVQAVKLAPMLKASAIYYKTKLCVHNYTIYNLFNSEVTCHLWDETQGGLEANMFATMLSDYLQNHLLNEPDTKEFIIYSDGCGYQNKNATVANALLKFAIDNHVTVYQKYFEKGHSQMEVDSVHSTIERRLKNRDIYLPTDYIAVCKEARNRNPYNVKYMKYTDFRDYSKVKYYSSIRPGRKPGDPQVNQVHCFMYSPEGIINYKLQYKDEWQVLPTRSHLDQYEVTQLYDTKQNIKQDKFNHLQHLKQVLDQQFWEYYDNLPHA
ncbi:uncharacterized protein LOC116167318 [Photinus pyralis]|nr:uncharacterized protein LOC116167318 [Photinus pyralis]